MTKLTTLEVIKASHEESHDEFVTTARKLLDVNGFPYSKTNIDYLYLQRKLDRVAYHRKQWLHRGKSVGMTLGDFKKWLKQNKWKWDGTTSAYIFPMYIVRVKELIEYRELRKATHLKANELEAFIDVRATAPHYSTVPMKDSYRPFGYFEPKGL